MTRLPLHSPLSRGALVATFALLSACAGQQDEPRGAVGGKADLVGSCAQSNCDDQAPDGECFCDADCVEFGDCCDDFTDNCVPTTCGGLLGIACDDGEACMFDADQMCGTGDQTGICEKVNPGGACPAVLRPVCGCNGVMFDNSCEANRAGVSISTDRSLCQTSHDSCGDKSCGDLCRQCAPGDIGCVETAVVKTCNIDGECTPSAPQCDAEEEEFLTCADKPCGDVCTLCAPDDVGCVETSVLKFCQPEGDCGPTFPVCN